VPTPYPTNCLIANFATHAFTHGITDRCTYCHMPTASPTDAPTACPANGFIHYCADPGTPDRPPRLTRPQLYQLPPPKGRSGLVFRLPIVRERKCGETWCTSSAIWHNF
jgi:hypothetical protein